MKFNEDTLEQAVIELFAAQQIPHVHGETIHKEMSTVITLNQRPLLLNKLPHSCIKPI